MTKSTKKIIKKGKKKDEAAADVFLQWSVREQQSNPKANGSKRFICKCSHKPLTGEALIRARIEYEMIQNMTPARLNEMKQKKAELLAQKEYDLEKHRLDNEFKLKKHELQLEFEKHQIDAMHGVSKDLLGVLKDLKGLNSSDDTLELEKMRINNEHKQKMAEMENNKHIEENMVGSVQTTLGNLAGKVIDRRSHHASANNNSNDDDDEFSLLGSDVETTTVESDDAETKYDSDDDNSSDISHPSNNRKNDAEDHSLARSLAGIGGSTAEKRDDFRAKSSNQYWYRLLADPSGRIKLAPPPLPLKTRLEEGEYTPEELFRIGIDATLFWRGRAGEKEQERQMLREELERKNAELRSLSEEMTARESRLRDAQREHQRLRQEQGHLNNMHHTGAYSHGGFNGHQHYSYCGRHGFSYNGSDHQDDRRNNSGGNERQHDRHNYDSDYSQYSYNESPPLKRPREYY